MSPEASAEAWAAGWEAAGLAGGIFLIFGLILRASVTRIASEHGIKKLRAWGGGCYLFRWADIRSWRVESFEEASYDTDGQGGMATRTRLVVELESVGKPLVLEQASQAAVVAELNAIVPMRRRQNSEQAKAADMRYGVPPYDKSTAARG
jgi:hypothetical protein